MRKLNTIFALASILLLGCETITVRPGGGLKTVSEPTYSERKDYYLWGYMGEHRIDTMAICKGKPAAQFQSQATANDFVLTLITIGIYAPRSAHVWCDT